MALRLGEKESKEIYKEIGLYIHECRIRRKLSLQVLGVRLGVNPSYLGQVERGERVPDDDFIRNLSELCKFDENYLYDRLGKVPLIAREELERHVLLQEMLKKMGMSSLSEQKKDDIYQHLLEYIRKELDE